MYIYSVNKYKSVENVQNFLPSKKRGYKIKLNKIDGSHYIIVLKIGIRLWKKTKKVGSWWW